MGSIRRGLIVMAKRPAPGMVKTRLCPPLTPEQAADLATALLDDTLAAVRRAGFDDVILAFAPPDAEDWFAPRFPAVPRIRQQGRDLGRRLAGVFAEAWRLRYQPCVVLGTDSPDLPGERLHAAFDALRFGPAGSDVVLGPAEDGGYCLIGLKQPQPKLFRDIDWSTERVLQQTLARADSLGLRATLLPLWSDVDTFANLQSLAVRLQTAPPDLCPQTRAFLTALGNVHPPPQSFPTQ